ncbi:MAG: hypothetical protein N3G20_11475 [Verrucomicrobiae bacterium]|nr:hypothetical protein [Verrucomicrobiae bacterium]
MDYVYLVAAIVVWFVLVRHVFPRFGIRTCMSCACHDEEQKAACANKKPPVVDKETSPGRGEVK